MKNTIFKLFFNPFSGYNNTRVIDKKKIKNLLYTYNIQHRRKKSKNFLEKKYTGSIQNQEKSAIIWDIYIPEMKSSILKWNC